MMHRFSFEQLFSALPSPHMVLDRDLNFVAVNEAYEAATMSTRDTLVGRNVFDVFPNEGEAGQRLRQSIHEVLRTGRPDTIAYIEYDIPRPAEAGGGLERRYWTAVHSPLRDAGGDVIYVLQNTVDITELVRLRAAASLPFEVIPGERELLERVREAEAAYQIANDQTREFARFFQQSPGMVALLHGPDHVFTFANDSYVRFAGGRSLVGLPLRDALPELRGQEILDLLDDVFRNGRVQIMRERRVQISVPGKPGLSERFVDYSLHPIRDRNGAVAGIFVQGTDRTDSVQALERQRLLLDELNHRVKNTLSTVQSLARRSFRATADREEAHRVFEARILALSNAHNLLADEHWRAADLEAVLRQELAVFADDRFDVSGRNMRLNPKATIAFAMIFHELSSNAVKYGALSMPNGRVAVGWRSAEGQLALTWSENGVAGEGTSMTPGFGMRMLERMVTGELEGGMDLDRRGDQLTWTFRMPLSDVEEPLQVSHD